MGTEMKKVFRLPLLPPLCAYTLGLYTADLLPALPSPMGLLVLLVLLFLWAIGMIIRKTSIVTPLILLFFFALGNVSMNVYLDPPLPSHSLLRFVGPDPVRIEGHIVKIPYRSPWRTQLLIEAKHLLRDDQVFPVEGNLLLFLNEPDPPLTVGDRLRIFCRLRSPRGFRNPGGFSYERHLAFEGVRVVGFLAMDKGWVKIGQGHGNPLLLRVETWRDHIRRFLRREGDPTCSGIFEALVLGEQGNIPDEVKESFGRTGITHLLAISGDHLGIVAFLSYSLLIWVLKRSEIVLLSTLVKKWAAGLTIPCVVLYTFVAGAGMSVVRATIMVVTFFLSILIDRERHLLHTLAVAAFLILFLSPPSLFDVSFQLSFAAVLSILYLVPSLLREPKEEEPPLSQRPPWRRKLGQYVRLSFWATLAASVGTGPLVLFHFNRISPMGLVTNLFAIPWVGFLIVPLSLLASFLSFFFSDLARLLLQVNNVLCLGLLKVIGLFASVPFASLYLPTPSPAEIFLFYGLLFLSVHLRKVPIARYLFVGLGLLLALFVAYGYGKDLFQKELRVTFLDVGPGDSILVEFPAGRKMLIDGGGLHDERFDIGRQVVAPFLWRKKIRRIDYLVLTHPDPDHLKGLPFIASHFTIGEFWSNGFPSTSEAYTELERTLKGRGLPSSSISEDKAPVEINGVRLSFFNPPHLTPPRSRTPLPSFINNQSLVLKLEYGRIGFLFAGDVEKEAEQRMIGAAHPLEATVLKVPHHGSLSSSSGPFIEAVRPTFAIFSVGEHGPARLPHEEVLKRYLDAGCRIFRTDRDGAITVRTDGQAIEVAVTR